MHMFSSYRLPHPGSTASPGVERARSKADSVEQRLDRALVTMEAMWTLLRERLQVTDEELAKRIVEVDESDGILDGKVRRPPVICPHCKKTIPSHFLRCLYCGEVVTTGPFA
jgi:hypothetical protein